MPIDRLIYAVGDIHGRADLLRRLLDQIRSDAHQRRSGQGPAPLAIFLGDYVDRGPQSRQVIDMLLEFGGDPAFESRFLLGNHEDTMLDYLEGRISGLGWSQHGGDATFHSYGVRTPTEQTRGAWSACREALRQAVPASHMAFLRDLELWIAQGDLLFVHAGIRPGIAVEAQDKRDLLWIRKEFLQADERADEWLVIHGHTPRSEAYGGAGRLCLDSGSYLTGRLTAAVFDHDTVALIETDRVHCRPYILHK